MHRLFLIALAISSLSTAYSAETIATAAEYNAVAHFTSGIFNDEPIDVIEKANLNQNRIVLDVKWSNLRLRSYTIKVRILGPNRELIRETEYTFLPTRRSHHTWHWYEPKADDPTGDWTWEIFVNEDKAFDAIIPVSKSH